MNLIPVIFLSFKKETSVRTFQGPDVPAVPDVPDVPLRVCAFQNLRIFARSEPGRADPCGVVRFRLQWTTILPAEHPLAELQLRDGPLLSNLYRGTSSRRTPCARSLAGPHDPRSAPAGRACGAAQPGTRRRTPGAVRSRGPMIPAPLPRAAPVARLLLSRGLRPAGLLARLKPLDLEVRPFSFPYQRFAGRGACSCARPLRAPRGRLQSAALRQAASGRAQEHAPPPCKTLYAPIAVGRAGRLPPPLD